MQLTGCGREDRSALPPRRTMTEADVREYLVAYYAQRTGRSPLLDVVECAVFDRADGGHVAEAAVVVDSERHEWSVWLEDGDLYGEF